MVLITPVFRKKMLDLTLISVGGAVCFSGIAIYKNNAKFHRAVTMPLLQNLDPETSHQLGVLLLKYKLLGKRRQEPSDMLHTRCLGLDFKSPIGMAAGFDKDGEAIEGLFRLGFGFVEIGSVTPKPQAGNLRPRVFRLTEDEAIINRYGFNSAGHEAVAANLRKLPPPGQRGTALVGVNLGKNKESLDHNRDYRTGVRELGPLADYLVINVSSPNTPGLRGLQSGGVLGELVEGVQEELGMLSGSHRPPLLVKIAPDLSEDELKVICNVLVSKKVDGVIVSNTTTARPSSLRSQHRFESGGLSGRPLEDRATQAIRAVAKHTKGALPIIGVGGVSDGAGVYAKLRAGASLVQLYTALVFQGPCLALEIEQQLLQLMERDGVTSIAELVGKDIEEANK